MQSKCHADHRCRRHRGHAEGGQSALEFALSLPFLVAIVVGTFAVGMLLDRHMTVTQLARNAGNMYARGIDFASTQNQEVLLRAASSMGMTPTGGDGVVYLSLVIMAPPGSGNNENLTVVAQRFQIGNPSISPSQVGAPPFLPNGSVPDYLNDPNAVATLPAGITSVMLASDRIFVSEVAHHPRQILFPGIVAPDTMSTIAYF